MINKETLKEKQLIISQIQQYVPLFAKFFDLDISVEQYSKNLFNFTVASTHKDRQKLAKEIIRVKFTRLFGQAAAHKLKINLETNLAFNIADHHQVLNHPFLIAANVVSSANKLTNRQEKQDAIIVISSGDVPPNNYFSKSGFKFHGKQVPLFGASERESCSYYLPCRDFNFLRRLKAAKRLHEFTKEELDYLQKLQNNFDSLNLPQFDNYCDQISVVIKNTWPMLFEAGLRPTLPELLYITQEELATECLIQLLKQDSFITEALFNPSFRQLVLDNFRGIVVTWKEQENKGTHFFWRKYPGRPHSLRMYVQGAKLVPQDSRFKHLAVDLNKQTIIELLEKKEIYPSLFTIFSVLNFYMGIRPLTGYGSVVYLELFKQAWLKTLKDSGFEEEIPLVESVETDNFVAGVPIFFGRHDGKLKTLYATDIYSQGGMSREYLNKIFSMKFNDLLSVAVADLYDYFSSKYIPERVKIKPKINFDDLAELSFDWI